MEPALAKSLGIATVYQEFTVFPHLTVAENIYMGEKTGRGPFIDRGKWNESAKGIFEKINVNIDVEKKVAELTTAYVQLVEIARALAKDAKVIIMDEPTAPLSNHEVESLFETISMLKAHGVTIVYISHRMGEIFNISDRISVMRDGCKVVDFETAKTNRQELIFHMVNRKIEDNIPRRAVKRGDVVLGSEKNMREREYQGQRCLIYPEGGRNPWFGRAGRRRKNGGVPPVIWSG
jgi:ribose transport system ATP-binding protein